MMTNTHPTYNLPANIERIIFYDGDCGFCQWSIQLLLKFDSLGKIYFAPLQGETAKGLLEAELRENLSTIVLLEAAPSSVLLEAAPNSSSRVASGSSKDNCITSEKPRNSEDKIYLKSSAIIRAVAATSSFAKLAYVLLLVPPFLRNFVYDVVAKNRKKLINNYCLIPTPEQQSRFLS